MNRKFKIGDKVQINMDKFLTHKKFKEVNDALDKYHYETTQVFMVEVAKFLTDNYAGNYVLYHDHNGTSLPRQLRTVDNHHKILTFRAAELRLASDNAPDIKKIALINWLGGELYGK